MKHTVYGVALAIMGLLIVAAVMTVSGRDVRENEMDKALNTAVEQSLEQLKEEGGYEIADYRELVADFNQALLLHISSDSDLIVNILTADLDRGVLDVQITEAYKTTSGKTKETTCRKTVILEEYSNHKPFHTITFKSEGVIHAEYSLYEDSLIVEPENPRKTGHTFKCWKNGRGEILSPGMKAGEDMVFTAIFE